MSRSRLLVVASLLCIAQLPCAKLAFGLGEKQHVHFANSTDGFTIVQGPHATPILISADEWPGVAHAADNLASDIAAVTNQQPSILQSIPSANTDIILIGTLGHSRWIDQLIASRKLDVSSIRGHWETSITQVVAHPFPGVDRALVIAGADKRGTIFGIYELSEQMGVSPWAWWADVPVPHHDTVSFDAGTYQQPEPRVKYRGIFLNDEAPALSGWTHEKFGGFNHEFYVHVFDLLLRLKANFLWPAMWGSAFNEDDPLNPKLANEYGIVMGTSHHEPMMRAQQEWKRHGTGAWDYTTNHTELEDFWRAGVRRNKNYEQLTTIGMRGDGDMAMSAETNTALLENIVAKQREILSQEVNSDVTKVPQVWALYKEVQSYYEKGMRVPDDVTLLWCDDNWGNLRRLPTAAERNRPGGAGIYYHFDYVGDPRSYKWINTNSITKVWEQMNLAVEYGADRMWIVNVGDLKPMEFPIEFFLDMARTPQRWERNNLDEFGRLWAAREFGPEHAEEIATLVDRYTKYNSRRKPEQLDPDTYSFAEDHEADRIEKEWQDLTAQAEHLNQQLPETLRPTYFELVLHPIEASATVGEMYIAAGRNRLYARQGRASANHYADLTEQLFANDAALSAQYNHLLNGKWNHMMDQTHIGYTFWNEPPVNAMPAVQRVQPLTGAHMAVFAEARDASQNQLPTFITGDHRAYTIDIANKGDTPFTYRAVADAPWVHLINTTNTVTTNQQITVSIDEGALPVGSSEGHITIQHQGAASDSPTSILVHAIRPAAEAHGFIEADQIVAIEAAHFNSTTSTATAAWQEIKGLGNTASAMESFPVTAATSLPGEPQACLTYALYLQGSGSRTLDTVLAPTLSFAPGHGLRYSLQIDNLPPTLVDAWASNTTQDWSRAVSDNTHHVETSLGPLAAGQHTLRFCRVDPGVALERLVIFSGAVPTSYLGPVESLNIPVNANTQKAAR